MTIETWLIIALVFSVATNIFLVWFSRLQSVKLTYVATNIGDLIDMLVGYREHLRKVYGMEMFYGDETLGNLMDHTRALIEIIDQEYQDITVISEPIELQETEEYEENEEEVEVKDVLYAGTRRRDS
tara:strand:- start:287 stop:667 length:381 start_codon:yes stop_codon:yes gene_type:complete